MLRFGLFVALTALVLDQVTKGIMLYGVFGLGFPALAGEWHPPIPITGFLNLVTVWNTGVSFGMFAAGSPAVRWVLIAVALGVSGALFFWMRQAATRLIAGGLGLIIGGAIGNVIDRVIYGAVADFIDVHVLGYHWPAFNVADSSIMIGVAILLYDSLFGHSDDDGNRLDHQKHS